ncbi:hypothetical protein SNE40_009732 [Patella caerulea]|uniref:Retrotransposon gag domain-containing protein n=1 Tax=Patella caerulea TaxID=87958 RepID=A0AAN8JSS1_PATCE
MAYGGSQWSLKMEQDYRDAFLSETQHFMEDQRSLNQPPLYPGQDGRLHDPIPNTNNKKDKGEFMKQDGSLSQDARVNDPIPPRNEQQREGRYVRDDGATRARENCFNPSTIPRSLSFNGKSDGSWNTFSDKFVRFALSQPWGANSFQCMNYLCYCLSDKAADYFTNITRRYPEMNFQVTLEMMEKRFGGQDIPEAAHVEFQMATQGVKESISDWSDRVQQLALRAYSGFATESFIARQSVLKLVSGCNDPEAGRFVANLRLIDMEEAVERLQWYTHVNTVIPLKSNMNSTRGSGYPGADRQVGFPNPVETESFSQTFRHDDYESVGVRSRPSRSSMPRRLYQNPRSPRVNRTYYPELRSTSPFQVGFTDLPPTDMQTSMEYSHVYPYVRRTSPSPMRKQVKPPSLSVEQIPEKPKEESEIGQVKMEVSQLKDMIATLIFYFE